MKRVRKSGWRTYFGRGIRQTVQGGTLARRRLANECNERIARHFGLELQSKQGSVSSYGTRLFQKGLTKGTMSSVGTKVVVRSGCGCQSCLFEDRVLLHARAFPSDDLEKRYSGTPDSCISTVHTTGQIESKCVSVIIIIDGAEMMMNQTK